MNFVTEMKDEFLFRLLESEMNEIYCLVYPIHNLVTCEDGLSFNVETD